MSRKKGIFTFFRIEDVSLPATVSATASAAASAANSATVTAAATAMLGNGVLV